jgi:hypothetical protein
MATARMTLLVSLLLALSGPSPRAGEARQAQLEVLRDTILANKRALVAVNLPLTDDEAARFWPIYERYESELKAINDRVVKLIDEYTQAFLDLPDDRARTLIGDYLGVETDRAKLRQSYLPEISKALPGRKVARFYQIENKMDAVVRYELAAHIPVVEP